MMTKAQPHVPTFAEAFTAIQTGGIPKLNHIIVPYICMQHQVIGCADDQSSTPLSLWSTHAEAFTAILTGGMPKPYHIVCAVAGLSTSPLPIEETEPKLMAIYWEARRLGVVYTVVFSPDNLDGESQLAEPRINTKTGVIMVGSMETITLPHDFSDYVQLRFSDSWAKAMMFVIYKPGLESLWMSI
jgi:hypothetical protein